MLNALYILGEYGYDLIYGPEERDAIKGLVNICGPMLSPEQVKDDPSVLRDIDIILSGWGAPALDEDFLNAAPNLKAVFYGAGSVRAMVTDAFWNKNIVLCSAWQANAVPVAEYCVSQILFCLKLGWSHVGRVRKAKDKGWERPVPVPGAYGSTVGLVSLGMIGRKTLELLRPYDVRLAVYSTSMTPEAAAGQDLRLCSLEEIFRLSDVVSLHTANLPETRGMITGAHFAMMKQNASFINTARGAVVREDEMIEVLKLRPDITAVLDVTDPEPPAGDSPLYTLPNVVLTPHIAGSMNDECHRMAQYMIDDLRRFINNEPLQRRVTREQAERLA